MGETDLVTLVTQIGIIPALFAYTLISVKKSLDANTKVLAQMSARLGGITDEK